MDAQDRLPASNGAGNEKIYLRLYIAGATPNSLRAVENLKAFCQAFLPSDCDIEIVDVLKAPLRALGDDILVTPTLLKLAPAPKVRVIGDLSDESRLLSALGDRESF